MLTRAPPLLSHQVINAVLDHVSSSPRADLLQAMYEATLTALEVGRGPFLFEGQGGLPL